MPSRLPLLQRYYLDGQSLEWWREHLNAYQSRLRRPSCWLQEPLGSLLLWSGICLSPPLVIGMKRQSIPRALLLLQGTCWSGSTTGGRSSWARKFGRDTSIWASRWSLTFMAWPISWYISEIGSKSKIKWTALNCLSSLTKISDLNK